MINATVQGRINEGIGIVTQKQLEQLDDLLWDERDRPKEFSYFNYLLNRIKIIGIGLESNLRFSLYRDSQK